MISPGVSLTGLSASSSQLAQYVAQLVERLEAGEPVDLHELCADCPENHEQLASLLPTLEAIVQLERGTTVPLPNSVQDASPTTSMGGTPSLGEHAAGILGDFRILRELGRGGMGVVYEAEQISLGRRVALKVLPFAAMLDKQQLNRFKNEARAAATLDHPNIVAIHFVGCERSVHFYAMQLIEGQSLAEVIVAMRPGCAKAVQETPTTGALLNERASADTVKAALPTVNNQGSAAFSNLPNYESQEYFRAIARLGIQAAEALDHAHQNGILHRDIKPANLLVDDTCKLWVTDFGLARIEQDAGMTMTGDILGTLRYMSPEQALAKRVVVDHRSDIYSLGATLYEILTLQPVITGDDRQELLRQLAFEEPRKPRQINARIPQDLETVVLRAIEKNPADRYATASDLAEDLRRFIDDRPIKAKPPTYRQRAAKWSNRHRHLLIATTIVLIIMSLLAVAIGVDRWRHKQETTRFVRESLEAAQTALEANHVEEATRRSTEARMRIDANRLDNPSLSDAVETTLQESERYTRFDSLFQKARNQSAGDWNKHFSEDALKLYGVEESPNWLAKVRNAGLPKSHVDRITEAVYELLLLNAYRIMAGQSDATGSGKMHPTAQGIQHARQYLEKAASFHAPSRGYYWLLANTSSLLGDQKREAELRKIAMQTPAHHAAELYYIYMDQTRGLFSASKDPTKYTFAEKYRDCLKILDFDPSYYNGLYNLGICFGDENRHAEAIAVWYGCLSIHPNDFAALHNRALAQMNLGHYAEAIADFRHAIQLQPAFQPLHFHLGAAYYSNGQLDDAIASCREAIQLDPKCGDAYSNLGLALHAKGKFEEAITAYESAIQINPNDDVYHGNLGNSYVALLRIDEGIREYREAIRLEAPGPTPAQRYGDIAMLLNYQGKTADALVELRNAVRIAPRNALIRCRLAEVLRSLGMFDEAIVECREAMTLSPDDGEAHAQLAKTFADKGVMSESNAEYQACIAALRKQVAINPQDAPISSDLAYHLATRPGCEVQELHEALSLAQAAAQNLPTNGAAHSTLGVVHYRLGNWQDSAKALQKSLKIPFGENAETWFYLAMAERQLNNSVRARECYAKAVEWMTTHNEKGADLIRIRREAEQLLAIENPRPGEQSSETSNNANVKP